MPVAATLNVAVCPAVIFALAGSDVIVGATALGDVLAVPVPLRATVIVELLGRLNSSEPEYACAADGLNVTETVRLWPGFKWTGKVGPEKENWATDAETLEMVRPCLLSFVMVTVCDPVAEPTVSLPKLTEEGLTPILACAADPKASKIAMAAAAF